MSRRRGVRFEVAAARIAMAEALRRLAPPNAVIELGKLRFLSAGASRRAFVVGAEISPDPEGIANSGFVVLIPRRYPEMPLTDRVVRREARLLEVLHAIDTPFRSARPFFCEDTPAGLIAVQSHVDGYPLRAHSRYYHPEPHRVVAEVAAGVHAVDLSSLSAVGLPTRQSRTEHVQAHVGRTAVGFEDDPIVSDVLSFVAEYEALDEQVCLLHGDLNGQNIHLRLEGGPTGLVDWSGAEIGDPAFDLAIVTRASKNPFGKKNGQLPALLEAYHQAGGRPMRALDVHVHELAILMSWYLEELAEHGPQERTFQLERRLEKLLDRTIIAAR